MKKDILGILGGMGPYAALEFNKKILDYDNASKDWDYTHTILDNNITIPSRTRHLLFDEENPTPFIVEAINNLSKLGVKAVVLPCNSVHFFYDSVIPYIDIPWINMLEVVSLKIKEGDFNKSLILGGYVTVNKKTYDPYLKETFYLTDDENATVYALIEAAKLNDIEKVEMLALKLIKYFEFYKKHKGIDSILYACTELTLSDSLQNYLDIATFDSNEIYAKYAIEYMRK